jgi:hypothetical protein
MNTRIILTATKASSLPVKRAVLRSWLLTGLANAKALPQSITPADRPWAPLRHQSAKRKPRSQTYQSPITIAQQAACVYNTNSQVTFVALTTHN